MGDLECGGRETNFARLMNSRRPVLRGPLTWAAISVSMSRTAHSISLRGFGPELFERVYGKKRNVRLYAGRLLDGCAVASVLVEEGRCETP